MAFDGKPRQVDGGEGQVAAGIGNLPGGVIDIAHDAGAAAHGGNLRLRMAGLVVLQVKGRIQEHIVGEQAAGADLTAQPEQVVVGVLGIVVDALFDLENVDGEDAGFAMAQTGIQRQQDVSDDHSALGGGVGAVVNRGEGGLRTGTGVHGVEVVDKALHGLIGVAVCGVHCALPGPGDDLSSVLAGEREGAAKGSCHSAVISRTVFQPGLLASGLLGGIHGLYNGVFGVV